MTYWFELCIPAVFGRSMDPNTQVLIHVMILVSEHMFMIPEPQGFWGVLNFPPWNGQSIIGASEPNNPVNPLVIIAVARMGHIDFE